MSSEREREEREERRSDARGWADKEDSKFAPTSIKLPPGFTAIKLKPPSMLLDIIEYRVGANNPNCDEGLLHFELTYYVHRCPSPDGGQMYCCLWENWKEPCPICDWMRDNARTQDPQLLKDMRTNTRHLFNAIDLNTRDQKMQVLDANHFNRGMGFGEQLKDAIRAVPRYADFAQYNGGYSLNLTVKEQSMGGGKKYNAATRIDFIPRDKPYTKGILDECCKLEDCRIHHTYESLRALFLQQGTPARKQEEPERGGGRRDREEPPREETRRRYEEPAPRQREEPPPAREREREPEPRARDEAPPRQRETEAPPRREEPPAAPPTKQPVAQDYDLHVGDKVTHAKFGVCEIVRVSGDGTSLTIEEVSDGVEHRAISPADVTKATKTAPTPPPTAATPPPAPKREETPPARGSRRDDDFDRPRREPAPRDDARRRD